MAITAPEATIWAAVFGSAGIALGAIVKWLTGRRAAEQHLLNGARAAEERNAEFWQRQVTPLTERVTSLETELARVKDAFALEAHTNAARLQTVQVAHAETLRAVQDKCLADIRAERLAREAHARELTAQFRLELDGKDLEIATLRQENVRLIAGKNHGVRPPSPSPEPGGIC